MEAFLWPFFLPNFKFKLRCHCKDGRHLMDGWHVDVSLIIHHSTTIHYFMIIKRVSHRLRKKGANRQLQQPPLDLLAQSQPLGWVVLALQGRCRASVCSICRNASLVQSLSLNQNITTPNDAAPNCFGALIFRLSWQFFNRTLRNFHI